MTSGPLVICSTPPLMKISPSPAFMARLAWTMLDNPEEQSLLIVSPGTVQGNPARRAAILATFLLSSPAWLAHPIITSSIFSACKPGVCSTKDRMTCARRSSVLIEDRVPLNLPKAVLSPFTI